MVNVILRYLVEHNSFRQLRGITFVCRSFSSTNESDKPGETPKLNKTKYKEKKAARIIEKYGNVHDFVAPRTPIGMRDYTPEQVVLRQTTLDKIATIFKRHGAETMDTPVIEHKDVLRKYGEESKLIYNLESQGSEKLALRYDLTVPLARYLGSRAITNMKRYHIGKVYRRDHARVLAGRYREFFQCDFDIAGVYDPMLPDAECIRIMSDVLKAVNVGEFIIRINHRQLLDGIFQVCGVPGDKFTAVCSCIDALDKSSWDEVRARIISEKGIEERVADKIGEFVRQSSGSELIDQLLNNEDLAKIPTVVNALNDTKLLLEYCKLLNVKSELLIDLSLARGLDYYTGVIYEATLKSDEYDTKSVKSESVGSIAGGGRYDHLVETFYKCGTHVPCVGLSIGVERIFSILEARQTSEGTKIRTKDVDVVVISAHKGLHKQRMEIISKLWDAGISAEHSYKRNPKVLVQFQHCEKYDVPLALVLGDNELSNGEVLLRDVLGRKEELVKIENMIEEICKRLNSTKNPIE